ncbi:unnamed protein product [Caretta caretta]
MYLVLVKPKLSEGDSRQKVPALGSQLDSGNLLLDLPVKLIMDGLLNCLSAWDVKDIGFVVNPKSLLHGHPDSHIPR